MQRGVWRTGALVVGCWLCCVPGTVAKPAYRRALADYFGPLLPAKLNNCQTCHLPDSKDDEAAESKPHNRFGSRVKAIKKELEKAGKKFDIPARLEALANEDSDGDGVPNLIEILTGHNPGDPADTPSENERAGAGKLMAAFAKSRAGMQWNPFETVRRPAVPTVRAAGWVRNPVDAFIALEHEKLSVQPRPEAPRHILLRRIYLDLIGLPPTPAELHAFLNDPAADAYEKVVDELLARPEYGERWGRHWMDVWRYSDWYGFGEEVRDSQRHIWHWRDWIVESLNEDKGYDRMIQEMLAGDELAPGDPQTLRATGFLVRNWFLFNRNVWLENIVEHTSKAFLGVTLNCARCHDHFFDPISQQEYYAFRAFFEPHQIRTDRVPGQPDPVKAGLPRVFDADLQAATYVFVRGNEANPDKSRPIPPAVPTVLGGPALHIQPVKLPLTAFEPDKRAFVVNETVAAGAARVQQLRQACAEALLAIQKAETGLAAARAVEREAWTALQGRRQAMEAADGPTFATLSAVWQAALSRLNQTATGVSQALQALERAQEDANLAKLALSAEEAKQSALLTVLQVEALEDAGIAGESEPQWQAAALAAGIAQRRQAVAQARHAVRAAELELSRAKPEGREPARKRLAETQAQLTKAEKEALAPARPSYTKRPLTTYPATSSGRRLALARWISDPTNPLTARVAVNHLWLRHFGKPLVPTVFDFGRNGRPPTHPALLDWLAAELMANRWSMKHLHRLLVTSSAYRMDSHTDARAAMIDPDNRYLWRMNSRRLEAEAVRDSVLAVAGSLDRARGGPDLDHEQGETIPRRSLYFRHAAEKEMEFLKVFDASSVIECYQRTETVVPQQALALANSNLVAIQSRRLARMLSQEVGPTSDATTMSRFIRLGFEQVLARTPTPAEQAACERFLTNQQRLLNNPKSLTTYAVQTAAPVPPATDAALRARENLIQVLMNHNDFVTIR